MSIAEALSAVKSLSRDEKRQLVKSLLDELDDEELQKLFPPQDCHLFRPECGPGAVAILAELLEEDGKCR